MLPKHSSLLVPCDSLLKIKSVVTDHVTLFVPLQLPHLQFFDWQLYSKRQQDSSEKIHNYIGHRSISKDAKYKETRVFHEYILFPSRSSQRILCIRVPWGNVNVLVWGRKSREILMRFSRTDDKKTTQIMWLLLIFS